MRRLLADLDRPQTLVRSTLGTQLKDALGTESIRDAVLWVVDKAFEEPTRSNALLRDVIVMCDVKGHKGSQVASELHVSTRTFFRLRADAIAALAQTAEQVLQGPQSRTDFKYEITRMISPVKPETAAHLLEGEVNRMGGGAAYEAVCACARNGRAVPASLMEKCTGHWRPLAELEVARTNLNHGSPQRYQETRPAIVATLDGLAGAARERVEFELAYIDRLDAVRRCDVDAGAEATRRMVKAAGADLRLRALAYVCQAEQACDEADLNEADTILRELQAMCLRLSDFRISARTSHVSSILNLLKGNYAEASDLCEVTIAALGHIEPEFAACAAALGGRAELFLGRRWERPQELCDRFPQSYVTSLADAVWARHLVSADPQRALAVAERALAMAQDQEALGVAAYAQATIAIAYELLGRRADAQRLRVRTWEQAMPLRRPFYLYDMFVHPTLPSRELGTFALDDSFLLAMQRRFAGVLAGLEDKAYPSRAAAVFLECLNVALQSGERARRAPGWRTHSEAALALRHAVPLHRDMLASGLQRLAQELAWCLPVPQRSGFTTAFTTAATDLFGAQPA